MKRSRRDWLKHLATGVLAVVAIPVIQQEDILIFEDDRSKQKQRTEMKQAEEEARREVEELYSTKPKRVFMDGREYVIPANYFGPKERLEPDTVHASYQQGFGFSLFLPHYGGYTKENWRDRLDPRRIDVVDVRPVRKEAIGTFTDGTRRALSPDRFDPRKRFERQQSLLEDVPSFKLYGLEGYKSRGAGSSSITWTGKRSNGEFFYFKTPLAPNEPLRPGITNPLCDVRYYSKEEGIFIVYRYSMRHLAKWREIDDAIWAKLREWQIK